MKLFGLTCALLFAFTGANGQSLSDQEADLAWFKLQIMTSGENEAARLTQLNAHGISQSGARALVAHVDGGEATLRKISGSITNLICDDQQTLREGGQEGFAQLIERYRAEESNTRRKLVQEAKLLLADADQSRLNYLMSDDERGPKAESPPSMLVSRIREGKISVEFAIDRTCKK
ncbi:MAG TPA: hypothetical protein VFR18_09150 [Terriglobia bacterium]|nr:hypothetical protein [Terriglobia bacterium]HEU5133613.1 hypothetical protein [Steroidobacteraceae bacterium]